MFVFSELLKGIAAVLQRLNEPLFQFLNPPILYIRRNRGLGTNLAKWRIDYGAMNVDEKCETIRSNLQDNRRPLPQPPPSKFSILIEIFQKLN